MCPDLLQTLQVFAQLVFEGIGSDLRKLSVFNVLLSVEEPVGDLVLAWIRHNGHQLLNLSDDKHTIETNDCRL